jgi:hypothetical protein
MNPVLDEGSIEQFVAGSADPVASGARPCALTRRNAPGQAAAGSGIQSDSACGVRVRDAPPIYRTESEISFRFLPLIAGTCRFLLSRNHGT